MVTVPQRATASRMKPVTVITGASAGIGAALARVFAAHGHDLVIVARREAQLKAVADEIAASGRRRPHLMAIDLARWDAGGCIAEGLLAHGVEPMAVVNNAGFGCSGDAAALDREEQIEMIDLNVRAVTDMSLRFVDSLERNHGGILNVASIAGFLPGPGMAVYHATKAYVLSFTQALHEEFKPRGIRVTALCPGPVETEFQARAGIARDHFVRPLVRTADRVARDGYDGFVQGRLVVVPGFHNWLATELPRVLPRALMQVLSRAGQRSPISSRTRWGP
jgi:short-subunit dehydrogenase